MRLRLADSGEDDVRSGLKSIVDRETGQVLSCNYPLSGNRKQRRAFRKQAHEQGAEDRIQARVDARNAKQANRIAGRSKGGDDDDSDDSGGDDGGDDSGDDSAMNDAPLTLSGVGGAIAKAFTGKKKKGDVGGAAKAAAAGAVKVVAPGEDAKPKSWFDGQTAGVSNKVVAGIGAAGLALLLLKK
jgi:hypothetical protein